MFLYDCYRLYVGLDLNLSPSKNMLTLYYYVEIKKFFFVGYLREEERERKRRSEGGRERDPNVYI